MAAVSAMKMVMEEFDNQSFGKILEDFINESMVKFRIYLILIDWLSKKLNSKIVNKNSFIKL